MSYDQPYSGEDSNFIKKYWNGDYSLGKSYWGNTVLVSVVTALLAFFALSLFNDRSEARYSSIAVLSVSALSVAVWIWSVRGTWASASKHVSRGGKAFWAGAARVADKRTRTTVFGKPTWQHRPRKGKKTRQCLHCRRPFDLRHAAQRFCNLRCFALYGRSKYPTSRYAITKAICHAKSVVRKQPSGTPAERSSRLALTTSHSTRKT
jgi:hypothetical protein